jgi:hypothetical protein
MLQANSTFPTQPSLSFHPPVLAHSHCPPHARAANRPSSMAHWPVLPRPTTPTHLSIRGPIGRQRLFGWFFLLPC